MFLIIIYRFKNRPGMSFDEVKAEPDQTFELTVDPEAHIEYATKYVCNYTI